MGNLFDYLKWRADISLSVKPFNEVDNLLLAGLSYTVFDGILSDSGEFKPLAEVADAFFSAHPREDIQKETGFMYRAPLLMDGMLSGERFHDMKLGYYINEVDSDVNAQISAVTFLTDDGCAYIAFRGTDSTLTGWREDFNLSYLPMTPGQKHARDYLNRVGSALPLPLRVGGHSKGGNFAVYASAFCERSIRDRITAVYTNDGPGFRDEVIGSEEYQQIIPKVQSIIPDTSVIGLLLSNTFPHHVVKSTASGLMQHDPSSWIIDRDRFEDAELSDTGQFLDKTLDDWIGSLDNEERQSLTESVFTLLSSTGVDTFHEMSQQKFKSTMAVLTALSKLPKDRQAELLKHGGNLIQSSSQNARSQFYDKGTSQT